MKKDITLTEMANIVANHIRQFNSPDALHAPPTEETAKEHEIAVVKFKKQKVFHPTNLALEQLRDMSIDPNAWSEDEKDQLVRNLFQSVDLPMPKSLHYMMYA